MRELSTLLETGQELERIRLKQKDISFYVGQIEASKQCGITADTDKITAVILSYQNTKNPEGAFLSLLNLRKEGIVGRSSGVLVHHRTFPRVSISAYSDINDLLFSQDNHEFILLEEGARRVLDYVNHKLISAFWNKMQIKPISDHTKSLVMELPSLWPLLEKKKGPHETHLEDGSLL